MTVSLATPFAPARHRPMSPDVRTRLDSDLGIVFRMLNRAEWVREFMLGGDVNSDLMILLSPLGMQSAITIDTEQRQEGRLNGTYRMQYLVVPSFNATEGLSGGAIVTTYGQRDHPLHAPSVMANTRIGRYVRDNTTGEWLILTRNENDNVTRMQWLHSRKSTRRERIAITCDSTKFNKGQFHGSILFECHDEEWRPCPNCSAPPQVDCPCVPDLGETLPRHPLDLARLAANALREKNGTWFGKVRVSILQDLNRELQMNIDACMALRTSFEASQDAALAVQMQSLALAEKANTTVPRQLPGSEHQGVAYSKITEFAAPTVSSHANEDDGERQGAVDLRRSTTAAASTRASLPMQKSSSTSSLALLIADFTAVKEDRANNMDFVLADLPTRDEKTPSHHLSALNEPSISNVRHSSTSSEHHSVEAVESPDLTGMNSVEKADTHRFEREDSVPFSVEATAHNFPHPNQQDAREAKSVDPLLGPVMSSSVLTGSPDLRIDCLEFGNTWTHPNAPASAPRLHTTDHNSTSQSYQDFTTNPKQHEHPVSGLPHEISHSPTAQGLKTSAHWHPDKHPNDPTTPTPQSLATNVRSVPISSPPASVALPAVQSTSVHAGPGYSAAVHVVPGHSTGVHSGSIHSAGVHPSRLHSAPAHSVHGHSGSVHSAPVQTAVHPASVYSVPVHSAPVRSAPVNSREQPHLSASEASREMSVGANTMSLDSDDRDNDSQMQTLARLEPRPPGMSASADVTWMWHAGHRGPFGMAAIAAARERERRAEERRRKNREAAARSNARAKERLERIKGELEKNKVRIKSLSRRQQELRSLNVQLKAQLAQNA